MASTIQVDKVQDTGGNTILSSNSTGTFTYEAASGANFTALDADNVSAGTLAIARGGTGAATLAAAGLVNTPNFHVKLTSNQSITSNTLTLIAFDTTTFDTDSGWSGASDYKWTVPSGKAGKYAISVKLDNYTGSNDMTKHQMELYKNGAREVSQYWQIGSDQTFRHFPLGFSYLADLSAGDYLQVYTKIVSTSPEVKGDEKGAYFEAYRIIGA